MSGMLPRPMILGLVPASQHREKLAGYPTTLSVRIVLVAYTVLLRPPIPSYGRVLKR